jgi:hypothetical protein
VKALDGDWRNVLIAMFASVIVTGGASWFAFGRDKISRAEATEIVREVSPYMRDKPVIDELRINVKELTVEVTRLRDQVTRLNVVIETIR